MIGMRQERAALEKADRDISEGEARIEEQERRLARLRADGHDTKEAEAILAELRQTLEVWRGHRQTIVQVLETARRERRG